MTPTSTSSMNTRHAVDDHMMTPTNFEDDFGTTDEISTTTTKVPDFLMFKTMFHSLLLTCCNRCYLTRKSTCFTHPKLLKSCSTSNTSSADVSIVPSKRYHINIFKQKVTQNISSKCGQQLASMLNLERVYIITKLIIVK